MSPILVIKTFLLIYMVGVSLSLAFGWRWKAVFWPFMVIYHVIVRPLADALGEVVEFMLDVWT